MKRLRRTAASLARRVRAACATIINPEIRAVIEKRVIANYQEIKGICRICPARDFQTPSALEAFKVAAILSFALAALPSLSFCYGEQITQAGVQLYSWLRGAGAVVTVLGLAIGGFQFAMGDREAAAKCWKVILGGLIIMLAPAAIGLIQGISGGAAAINTNG